MYAVFESVIFPYSPFCSAAGDNKSQRVASIPKTSVGRLWLFSIVGAAYQGPGWRVPMIWSPPPSCGLVNRIYSRTGHAGTTVIVTMSWKQFNAVVIPMAATLC